MLVIKKSIFVIGEGLTQGSDYTTITAKAKYLINFTESGKRSMLRVHHMKATVSYLLMLQKYTNSK